jgi:predicted membrane protein
MLFYIAERPNVDRQFFFFLSLASSFLFFFFFLLIRLLHIENVFSFFSIYFYLRLSKCDRVKHNQRNKKEEEKGKTRTEMINDHRSRPFRKSGNDTLRKRVHATTTSMK